ncbi:MAG: sigma-70 family RNA polymerase sigma factor [Acidobacteriaceae bacterium]|nr:sigma-70 family RNA polymerase sigma factor [Acidobacteriaceae bacterium]
MSGSKIMGAAADSTSQLTRMLNDWSAGDLSALDRLTPVVYAELHRIAECKLLREQNRDLLQPSALVNEAFLRMLADSPVDWQSRAHFFARSANIMRHVLVDIARKHRALRADLSSMTQLPASESNAADFLDVDAALNELAELDERQAQVVEMRYYGGLSIAEVAGVMGVSDATVNREWQTARAWLFKRLKPKPGAR